jgi:pyridoxal/pyridoxine/pyridoxamine kinase
MRHLCTRAHVITPNATEAALLTGRDPSDMTVPATQRAVLGELCALGPSAVVLTGAVRDDGTVGYLCSDGERVFDDCKLLYIKTPWNSYALEYAKAHEIPYEEVLYYL